MIAASPTLQVVRLRQTPWTIVLRNAWLTFLSLAMKDLLHLPDALVRTRIALAQGRWRSLPAAWLPPEVVGLIRLDHALRHGFMQWLLRKPRPAAPAGEAFGYLERGAYRTGVAIALFSIFVEVPLDAAVVPLLVKDPAARQVLHMLMFASCLSGVVWVMGDRWLVGSGQHVLDDEGLRLRVGARTTGVLPRDAIAACERLDEAAAAWCHRHGIAPLAALVASPLDKPNTVLILNESRPVRLMQWGVQRDGLACVFLYVDRPAALAAALRVL